MSTFVILRAAGICAAWALLCGFDDESSRRVAVGPGDRIQIETRLSEPSRVEGEVLALEDGAVVLAVEGRENALRVRASDMAAIRVSTGLQKNTRRGALIGMAVGGAVAVALLIDFVRWSNECEELICPVADAYGVAVVAASFVVLPGVGAGVGALIGSTSRSERWEPARLQGPEGPTVGLSVRIPLSLASRSR